jgi:hypothetical protein
MKPKARSVSSPAAAIKGVEATPPPPPQMLYRHPLQGNNIRITGTIDEKAIGSDISRALNYPVFDFDNESNDVLLGILSRKV